MIHKTAVKPLRFAELMKDDTKLNGIGVKDSEREISRLGEYGLKRDKRIIIDSGRHIVGKFSVNIIKTGSPQDAPLYIRLKFAEMPVELEAESADYSGWL